MMKSDLQRKPIFIIIVAIFFSILLLLLLLLLLNSLCFLENVVYLTQKVHLRGG